MSEESASKVDSLRAELAESQSAASKAEDKISRLEETAAERSARLESVQRANEKLEADLRSKVGKFQNWNKTVILHVVTCKQNIVMYRTYWLH